MRNMIFKKILVLLCFQFFHTAVQADSIVTTEATLKSTVQSIVAGEIKLKDGKSLPITQVKKIEFEAFPVAAKEIRVILKDGSLLNGVIREMGETLIFRSTTLCQIKIKMENVAAIVYNLDLWNKAVEKTIAAPCVFDKNGIVYPGKIMWFDSKSAGIMTEDGLKKIVSEDIGFVCYAQVKLDPKVILRNGDIINLKKEFTGTSMSVMFDDNKYDIPLKAVKEIIFQ